MANINRDYIIELLLQLPQYNKKFEIVPSAKPLQFYKDDRNQTIYILVTGWKEELTLKMAIKSSSTKQVLEYYPVFEGVEGDTHIFKVALSNEDILANPGKYEFQFFIFKNGTITSSNIDSFRVKDCL